MTFPHTEYTTIKKILKGSGRPSTNSISDVIRSFNIEIRSDRTQEEMELLVEGLRGYAKHHKLFYFLGKIDRFIADKTDYGYLIQ